MGKIGANIRAIRKKKNLTQKEVAERLGISQTAFRKFEMDVTSPRLDTMEKIAAALEVSVHELIPQDEVDLKDDQIRELLEQFNGLNESGKEKALDIVGILGRVEDLKRY